ncbi:hypothetical protein NEHOM01_0958 [Nematocida homosporus]|uniref:uncharacterized protein n=1 Tax=Nematocida homosporus TaxID=1912981 RepID=UPI00221F86EC|nr:uncharacterized protein NEHOM01_0958 [Nematocida homosporus]KAI5185632.1 hypothetical protein NEHOM01_0958 [Nematocida homosporus]
MQNDSSLQPEMEKRIKILENKILSILPTEDQTDSSEAIWKAALSLLKETLCADGGFAEEAIILIFRKSPESLGDHCDEVREILKRYACLTQNKVWASKEFYSLVLKTVFTEGAYQDLELIDKIVELCTNPSPKIRKRAFPALRRVIEYEDRVSGSSPTFHKLMHMVEAIATTSPEYSGKIISILGNLTQEISKYNLTDRMLGICQAMQVASDTVHAGALAFARSLLASSLGAHLPMHLHLLTSALQKEDISEEDSILVLTYAAEIFKQSNLRTIQGLDDFILTSEGSEVETLIKQVIKAQIERVKPEKLPIDVCMAIHQLVFALSTRIFPYFKKVIVMIAYYCYTAKDLRMSKEIELIIGNIGVEKFLKTIKEKEFYFWLPMMKASIHSCDLSVFLSRFVPEIQALRNSDKTTEFEGLWSCFPSFCRNASDSKNSLRTLLTLFLGYTSDPVVRGYICQGLHLLIEEAQRGLAGATRPDEIESKTKILQVLADSNDLLMKIVFRFRKSPTENERQYIRSMLSIVSNEWQDKYLDTLLVQCFAEEEVPPPAELVPEYTRKENDIPEYEKIFVENAHVLELMTGKLMERGWAVEEILKYCLSTHLRPQKMAYKVTIALIKSGYTPKSLLEFFLSPVAEQVVFLCSRHLRLETIYLLISAQRLQEGEEVCRLVFEMARTVRIEGGKNRKVAYDMAAEIGASFPADKLNEVCKMACAGIPNGTADYQAGAICILTSLIYNGPGKCTTDTLDVIVGILEELTAEKRYAPSKAILGFFSVVFTSTPHIDRYLSKALICIDRIIFHFKSKLHENIKLLLRKILDERNIYQSLTYPQKDILQHRPQSRVQEKDRVQIKDNKIHIRDQEIIPRKARVYKAAKKATRKQ